MSNKLVNEDTYEFVEPSESEGAKATSSKFGTVKPSDSYSATGEADDGFVASQKALSNGLATKVNIADLSDSYSATGTAANGKGASQKALSDGLATKAPKSHANSATTYGIGTGSLYGHVMLSDSYSATGTAANGKAPSQKALSDGLGTKAPTSHAASSTTYGGATASNYGHVKLSDSYSATGTAANSLAPSQKALSEGLATKVGTETIDSDQELAFSSYSSQAIHFRRIGRIVVVSANLTLNVAALPTGSTSVGQLPVGFGAMNGYDGWIPIFNASDDTNPGKLFLDIGIERGVAIYNGTGSAIPKNSALHISGCYVTRLTDAG